MTREEAIEVVGQLGLGIGPMGELDEDGWWEPRIDGYTVEEWIAQAPPEALDAFISLITSPPEGAPPRGSMQTGPFPDTFHEELSSLVGAWATRDSAAFWQKIGPLLLRADTRWSALMAVQFTYDGQELKWLLPLVEDIENISPEEQCLLIEAVALVDTPEAVACLEGLHERRLVGIDFQTRLAKMLACLRQTPSDYRHIPPWY